MILLKSLAVSVLLGNKCMRIRKAVCSENLTLNRFHQLCNFNVSWEKFPSSRRVERRMRFCTNSKELAEGLVEDLAGDVEEFDDPDDGKLTSELFEEIAAGDPGMLRNLKLLELEVAVLREEECRVPDRLTKDNWLELLNLNTATRRRKFLAFLRLNELKELSRVQKAQSKRELLLKYKQEQGFHYYGLSGHTMFMRVYEKDINRLLINRLAKSKLEVLLDCSYQEYMSPLNVRACAKQIFYCFSEARLHRYPCQLKLCNLNREDALGKILPNYVNGIYENFYCDIHSESYLDLYPKEKLVYLTPHTKTELHKFNPDDVYIIGAFVDKGTGEKASLAKAKEHQMRMAKFPIDEYLLWKQGTKSLPLNIVLNVLLDMAFYDDWNRAFRNIPTRCLTDS